MIMPFKDNLYSGRKGIGFEYPSYFEKAKNLRPMLYDEKDLERIKLSLHDYGNLNASYVNEKINFEDDYFQEIINSDFEKIDSPFQQTSSLKSYVPNVILEKIRIDLEDEVKKKGSFNTSNDDLSAVSLLKLNKNVKRYSRKDLLSCNNSHLRETSSAYVCNDAMNVSCNSRMCDLLDDNNFFMFDDESIVQICLWIIDSGCSKHMTGNRALLTNFVEKFLGTVRFGNNDFAVIAGYGDVVIGSMTIKKSTCFVRNEEGVDLLTGDRSSNLYTIALNEVASNSSTCLPKMKFEKDHLCSACEQGKIHRKHHMDLCGPMSVASIYGKRYVLVVVDDYSWCTWVFFLYSKDEASEVIISFIKKTQVNLQLQVQRVRTDNGTEFKNKTLAKFFDEAEAITTACFTQNHLIIHKRFDKNPYELMNKRRPNIKFFHVFECRCYLLNDYEDVRKLKAKGDIGVFVGYSKESAAFRIYNKRTRKIHESVNVNFDDISEMVFKQFSLELDLSNLNETKKSSNPSVSQVSERSKKDLEDLFQDFYDEYFDSLKIMKSSTTNVETLINEEVFHEVSKSFQGESSSSSLNDDV
uniref:Uncharacterized protein n=1 Tax=Tanacetum cinerariifolium TaxID=118510 RepID=A0A699JGI0_TANCI|nr:hypothetical protein [Tanacetum cinerariifolium]